MAMSALNETKDQPTNQDDEDDGVSVVSVASSAEKPTTSTNRRLRGKTTVQGGTRTEHPQDALQLVNKVAMRINKDGIFDHAQHKDQARKEKREKAQEAQANRFAKRMGISLKGTKAMKSMKSMKSMKKKKKREKTKTSKKGVTTEQGKAGKQADKGKQAEGETKGTEAVKTEGRKRTRKDSNSINSEGTEAMTGDKQGKRNKNGAKATVTEGNSNNGESTKTMTEETAKVTTEGNSKKGESTKTSRNIKGNVDVEKSAERQPENKTAKYLIAADGECQPEEEVRIRIFVENSVPRIQVRHLSKTVATLTEHHFGGHEKTLALAEEMRTMYIAGWTKAQIAAYKNAYKKHQTADAKGEEDGVGD